VEPSALFPLKDELPPAVRQPAAARRWRRAVLVDRGRCPDDRRREPQPVSKADVFDEFMCSSKTSGSYL
jgi:hypothetical protein